MHTQETIAAVILARGGSKSLPRKNLAEVDGRTLVSRSVESCQRSRLITEVVVSTDDADIAGEAARLGATVSPRPAVLAGDAASSEDALLDCLETWPGERVPTIVALVQCTSPFVHTPALDEALNMVSSGRADSAFSATRSSRFIWERDDHGDVNLVSPVSHDPAYRRRRQDGPVRYMETGAFYACRVSLLRRSRTRFCGRRAAVLVPDWTSVEVDTAEELQTARIIALGLNEFEEGARRSGTRDGPAVQLGPRPVGPGHSVYVVAEVGINHNGDRELAHRLIDVAADAGCQAVKFQKRDPDLCVPRTEREVPRDTPWGRMSYLEYRKRIEFDIDVYREIARHCDDRGIGWFASVWDHRSVSLLEQLDPMCYKIPSAAVTDHTLLSAVRGTGRPVICSTGMSTISQIDAAVSILRGSPLALMQSTSCYPTVPTEVNLRFIDTLSEWYGTVVGYSGHEMGIDISMAAVCLGAKILERHITLDRSMWGSDHAISLEPDELNRLVRGVRNIEDALGTGAKEVYSSERSALDRLRVTRERSRTNQVANS